MGPGSLKGARLIPHLQVVNVEPRIGSRPVDATVARRSALVQVTARMNGEGAGAELSVVIRRLHLSGHITLSAPTILRSTAELHRPWLGQPPGGAVLCRTVSDVASSSPI